MPIAAEMETSKTPAPPPEMMVYPVRPVSRGLRLFVFYSSALMLTGLVSLLFADLLWRSGWSNSATVLLVLFVLLFFLIAIGCMQGICGFVLRAFGDPDRITQRADFRSKNIDGVSTALVFPV